MPCLRYALLAFAAVAASPAAAQSIPADTRAATEPAADTPGTISLEGRYVLDIMSVGAGGDDRGARILGNLEVIAGVDLDRAVGWRGAKAKLHLLSNHGGAINDLAGTLQGVDNIEVSDARTKLYEAWIEQGFAGDRVSLLLGLADLNADFYQNDSAGTLLAPAFGIGSELAATGPNGPSIFPSTALTARVNAMVGNSGYVRAAVVNARAGVLGDESGIDFSMHDGALLIAEAGSTRGGKLAIGFWRYTRQQDDVREVDLAGDPLRRSASGAYFLVDQRVAGTDEAGVNLFLRAGLSEGKTTPFHGGFQAGALVHGLVPGRPDSQISFGVARGVLSNGFRGNLRDLGYDPATQESGVELTYQDRIASFLTVQPDLQFVRRAYADGPTRNTLILGLRLIAGFGGD